MTILWIVLGVVIGFIGGIIALSIIMLKSFWK